MSTENEKKDEVIRTYTSMSDFSKRHSREGLLVLTVLTGEFRHYTRDLEMTVYHGSRIFKNSSIEEILLTKTERRLRQALIFSNFFIFS